ncbi:phosphatase domain-containing protein [Cellulomonas sp. NPDC089187]|uniref:App1 family protein n=1 Tax=Cellulomonas sp. NPDC089187 TaxID=3154970 RepID=UPI00343EB008
MSVAEWISRAEDRVNSRLVRRLGRHGFIPRVVAYPSYGSTTWLRVRARILLTDPLAAAPGSTARRGWRNLLTAEVAGAEVEIRRPSGELLDIVRTDRGGYIDAVIPTTTAPGLTTVLLSVPGGDQGIPAPIHIIDPDTRRAVISDIDDTVLVTLVPRPHVALWNFLLRSETSRHAVPGMPELYQQLTADGHTPVFYLSNGAWNTAGALGRFLGRVGLPSGPLLLTDFGPTGEALFRSGHAHKASTLLRLADEFPDTRWILIGDNGQHDPELYRAFDAARPGRVAAVAIRELTPVEQVVASGTPGVGAGARRGMDALAGAAGTVFVSAGDGVGLAEGLRRGGVV